MNPPGPSRLFGIGQRVGVTTAAFANGALSQALEFDDTHNESIVHMSSPAVAAALALAESEKVSGRELIAAIAVGNEISCRVGSVAPGQFHRRGFHPTGLFAPFGATYLAGRLLGLSDEQLVNAAGIVGSFAAGILECWVDGTQSKFLHPGWAAQSGITAAFLGRAGTTGPTAVFEGRFGLFASHLQDQSVPQHSTASPPLWANDGRASTRRSSRSPPRTSSIRTSTRCCSCASSIGSIHGRCARSSSRWRASSSASCASRSRRSAAPIPTRTAA